MQSGYERNLEFQIKALKLPAPKVQYRFAPPRRWTFDLAWDDRLLACEVEGGTWIRGGGRHNRASSFERDTEKYNEAALRGWAVLRVTTGQVSNGHAVNLLERALKSTASQDGAIQVDALNRLCEAKFLLTGRYCTREQGHDGDHVATIGPYATHAYVLARWSRELSQASDAVDPVVRIVAPGERA